MRLSILLLLLLSFISCDKPPVIRQYTEETILLPSAPMIDADPHAGLIMPPRGAMADAMNNPDINQMVQASAAKAPIVWTTPEGWSEQPASGLRMATFTDNAGTIECSITALGGLAGGLESNITRWANQIQLQLSSSELTDFINQRTALTTQSGMKGSLLDFSVLQKKDDNTTSILAAVFDIEGTSIFIKMTGTQKTIEANRKKFRELIASLTLNGPSNP